jgi:hypothetical protein
MISIVPRCRKRREQRGHPRQERVARYGVRKLVRQRARIPLIEFRSVRASDRGVEIWLT